MKLPARLPFVFVAWFLIGLMTGGALVHYLSAPEAANLCFEERVLESEDGRFDLVDSDFLSATEVAIAARSFFISEVASRNHWDYLFAQRESHHERGPPANCTTVDC